MFYSTVHLIFILLAVQGQQKYDNSKYALMFKFQMLEKNHKINKIKHENYTINKAICI